MFFARSFANVALAFAIAASGVACSNGTDAEGASSADITEGVHEPQGAERSAIHAAFGNVLKTTLHGQDPAFNSTDPVGRFLAHGDWAYLEGILEGPNGNVQPLDYDNSDYKTAFDGQFLDGVQRNGNFAAKFSGLAHRNADGTWSVSSTPFGAEPTIGVGAGYPIWQDWASIPPPAFRDVFVSYPVDDLHVAAGAERSAILTALAAPITHDLHGQTPFFNSTDPPGSFLVHDGWAYYEGIIEGANGNLTPIDYRNSVYAPAAGSTFVGLLRNGNFAAICRAILHKDASGNWALATNLVGATAPKGYAVGSDDYVGSIDDFFAYDIYPSTEGADPFFARGAGRR